jgi:hypothetical protein
MQCVMNISAKHTNKSKLKLSVWRDQRRNTQTWRSKFKTYTLFYFSSSERVNIIFSPVRFLGQEGLQDSDPLEESKLTKEPTRTEFKLWYRSRNFQLANSRDAEMIIFFENYLAYYSRYYAKGVKFTFEIVRAGDHWSFKISRQIPPFELILQW